MHKAPAYARIAASLAQSGDAVPLRMDLYHHRVAGLS